MMAWAWLWLIGLVVFTGASVLWRVRGSARRCRRLAPCRESAGRSCSRYRWRCWLMPSAARTGALRSGPGEPAPTGLAVAIGPLLGGVLTSGLSWRWIFFVNVPIGIAAAVISVMKVAKSLRAAG